MKRNDITKLATQDVSELEAELTKLSGEMTKARLAKKSGKLNNLRSISVLSDDIARIKTVLRQKELAVQAA